MKLVVIEGPGKRATIKKYLGDDYEVFATKGHIRDLPVHGFGVDLNNNFEPKYEIMQDKQDVIASLKQTASKADQILLATDPDREGEAISWHVANVLGLDEKKNIRIEFNEISKNAVQNAIKQPRAIDLNLVDAQQARRVLDRIVGYKLSPILCKRIQPKLSAGRVQSVTLKLVVDREREILNFKPEEWWSISAKLSKIGDLKHTFNASFYGKNGKKLKIENEKQKDAFLGEIANQRWFVKSIKKGLTKSHAPAPYITSTMQQDALNKLGMTLKRTTLAAQNLYEGVELFQKGKTALITYIRTDSVRVSPEAQKMAKDYIINKFGEKYYPTTPNIFKSKKSAQDAHEAIRPIYIDITPESIKDSLSSDNYKLYKLIYERFLASQMSDATYNSVSLDINVVDYTFRATGRTPVFDGYTALYQEYVSKEKEQDEDENQMHIPELTEGEVLECLAVKADQKFTKPPLRYTEASLVKAMEDKGIGRPATYTPTVTLLFSRKYTENEGKYIKPTDLGCSVTDMLTTHFPRIMDIGFTADMESNLDEIAEGNKQWTNVIAIFYDDFKKQMDTANEALKTFVEETDEICDKCGSNMVIRLGKYGKFLACSNFPKCKNIKSLPGEPPIEVEGEQTDEICPECANRLVVRTGKYGKFLACSNYPTCTYKRNMEEKESTVICDKCGHTMVEKTGKYGKFLACSNYPTCKNIKSISQKVGICPDCGKDILEKVNKNGNVFYACSGYPDCKRIFNDKPTDLKCSKCGGMILRKEKEGSVTEYCSKCGQTRS